MRRWIILLLILGSIAAAWPVTSEPKKISDLTGPLDSESDLDAALRFEALIPEHTFYGMVTALNYDAWPHLDPDANVTRMDGEADSGNYTGVYLAAQSWRYAQAKAELKELGVDPLSDSRGGPKVVRFWRSQRDEALERAREMVDYFHILVNIAQYWETSFDPRIDDSKSPEDIGWLDYGGGVVPAEAGLLMRACTPSDPDPAYADVRVNYTGHYRHIGPLQWEDRSQWHCLGGTSRDSYAGTIFGLAVALDYLATDENADLRKTLAADLMAMTDYAAKYFWFQPRPHGTVANPLLGHNDLDGPISPLFIQVPLHKLHLLQTARHASHAIGDEAAAQRYELLWLEEVANTVGTGSLLDSMLIDAAVPHNAYYKYQLHLMSFFNLIRLEPDPIIREEFKRAMGVLDATLTDDGNAFFEAITYALTGEQGRSPGEQNRLAEAVGHHREWLDYYAFHEEAARVDNTPFLHTERCKIEEDPGEDAPISEQPLECVPTDQTDMVQTLPTGQEVTVPFRPGIDDPRPGTEKSRRAKDPLPVGVRRYADFLWQKDPTIITGDHANPWRGPSIDFLATYWMLRYYSEVEVAEIEQPLPAWDGPRFK